PDLLTLRSVAAHGPDSRSGPADGHWPAVDAQLEATARYSVVQELQQRAAAHRKRLVTNPPQHRLGPFRLGEDHQRLESDRSNNANPSRAGRVEPQPVAGPQRRQSQPRVGPLVGRDVEVNGLG